MIMQTWQAQLADARRLYPLGAVYVTTEVGRSRDRVVDHAWRRGVGVIVLMEQCDFRYRHWMRLDNLARCERAPA